jgi:hypothetical protein
MYKKVKLLQLSNNVTMGKPSITKLILILNLIPYTNKIKNAIIRANRAIASVSANPKIANLNKSSFRLGFLEVPKIRDPKINPIPIPAPASPKVDSPAPIFCAACNNIVL